MEVNYQNSQYITKTPFGLVFESPCAGPFVIKGELDLEIEKLVDEVKLRRKVGKSRLSIVQEERPREQFLKTSQTSATIKPKLEKYQNFDNLQYITKTPFGLVFESPCAGPFVIKGELDLEIEKLVDKIKAGKKW